MAAPVVLAYNLGALFIAPIDEVCRLHKARLKLVSPDAYALTIGELAGIPVFREHAMTKNVRFFEPMLVICHMLKPELEVFLDDLRKSDAPPVALKAVLTPYNAAWNARELRDELSREHESIMKRHQNS